MHAHLRVRVRERVCARVCVFVCVCVYLCMCMCVCLCAVGALSQVVPVTSTCIGTVCTNTNLFQRGALVQVEVGALF